jgi:two-component system OmpR family response regulator
MFRQTGGERRANVRRAEPPSIDAAPSILLASMHEARRSALAASFTERGVSVLAIDDEEQLREAIAGGTGDVVLIDVLAPGGEGLDLCRRLAHVRTPPILLLTHGADETDRIVALELGADACLPGDCSPRELLAQTRALIRRASAEREGGVARASARFTFAGWRLDLWTRVLTTPHGKALHLSATDLALLQTFVQHPGQVLSREHLRTVVGQGDGEEVRTIDSRVGRLRASLERGGGGGHLIRTVFRRGYTLEAEVRCG